MYKKIISLVVAALLLLGVPASTWAQQVPSQTFPSGFSLSGEWLAYYNSTGGSARWGFPISDIRLRDSTTARDDVPAIFFQYGIFEQVNGSVGPGEIYPDDIATELNRLHEAANTWDNSEQFADGKWLGGDFRRYWENHNGQQTLGEPTTNELTVLDEGDATIQQWFQYGALILGRLDSGPQFLSTGYKLYHTQYGTTLASLEPGESVTLNDCTYTLLSAGDTPRFSQGQQVVHWYTPPAFANTCRPIDFWFNRPDSNSPDSYGFRIDGTNYSGQVEVWSVGPWLTVHRP